LAYWSDWSAASIVHRNLSKAERRAVEAAYICTEDVTNTSTGFFKMATPVAHLIRKNLPTDPG